MIDSQFYIDLLQVIACLQQDEDSCISKVQDFKYGHVNGLDGERNVIGIENGVAFLNEVYKTEKVITKEAFPHYKINPLIKHLGIDVERYIAVKMPSVSVSAVPEGSLVKNSNPYLGFKTSYLFMAKTCMSIDRIIEFQTHILEGLKPINDLVKKYEAQGAGRPTLFNEGSYRTYSTTLSAYNSRANEIGVLRRFWDEDLLKRSEKYSKQINTPQWQVKSSELNQTINSKENQKLLNKSFGNDSAKLINDGIFYLKEEQFLDFNLVNFALDGAPKNLKYIDGLVKDVILPRESTIKDDFIIDSKYQNIYGIPHVSGVALYGQYGKSKTSINQNLGFIRANRNRIPKLICNDITQLNSIIDSVKAENKDLEIYFRGQNKHWDLNRSELTNELLYGQTDIEELSLPTSASRENFDFDGFSAILQFQLQGLIYSKFEKEKFDKLDKIWPLWGNFSPYENIEIDKKHEEFRRLYYSFEWDLMTMGLGQHYGIPTHGLDITSDINVALWFATNQYDKYEERGKEYAWYKPLKREHKAKLSDYPVIYIIGTKKGLKRDLDQIEFIDIKAERPKRQKAYLHYGGFGLHSNICAEDVIAAVFLTEDFKFKQCYTTDYLFPNHTDDPFYKALLELRDSAISEGLNEGYSKIVEYKPKE
ncbi:FRG domain-containing protein [Mangrovibacterium diazotrophicum]|uniref:FRG domain-containing protein n=1 Tax=Mangrovibacterium diazotrophicum TaxID=1261403 RepID=A0A419VWN0_9BACT|nr:FRG domain-containing protein [Mangrovibacterium diazotrophicum]RKD86560.1 FRG domain-containing protein [Mangrovibacterium diazotrophicum]